MPSRFEIQQRIPLIDSSGFSGLNQQRFNWNQQNLQTNARNVDRVQEWLWKVGELRRQREERNALAADQRQAVLNENRRFQFLQQEAQREAEIKRRIDKKEKDRQFKFNVDQAQAGIDYNEAMYELQRQGAEAGFRLKERELDENSKLKKQEWRQKQNDLSNMSGFVKGGGAMLPPKLFDEYIRRNVPPEMRDIYRNQYQNTQAEMRNRYSNAKDLARILNQMIENRPEDENDPTGMSQLELDPDYKSMAKTARESDIMYYDADQKQWSVRISPAMEKMLNSEPPSWNRGAAATATGTAEMPAAPPTPSGMQGGGSVRDVIEKARQDNMVYPVPLLMNGHIDTGALKVGAVYRDPSGNLYVWDGTAFDDGISLKQRSYWNTVDTGQLVAG